MNAFIKIFLFLVIVQLPLVGAAQLHDGVWTYGDGSFLTTNPFGVDLYFSELEPNDETVDRDVSFSLYTSSVCDANGKKLFYTNGCFMMGADDERIPGGDTLNPGFFHNQYCDYSYVGTKSSFFLPSPIDTNIYHYFHERRIKMGDSLSSAMSPLYETLLDKSMNNGNGGLIYKSRIILSDTLAIGQIAANRHANGRDWWLVVPEFSTPRHFIFLLDSSGIHLVREQWIGQIEHADFSSGTAVFSSDGTTYARFDPYNNLNIFEFDRCTGVFSQERFDVYDPSPYQSALWGSCCFSPNSRFLYVNDPLRVWQYDLYAADWKASKTLVAEYDGFGLPFGTYFFKEQLAADGKIYYALQGHHPYFHVINKPDEQGMACNLVQRGLELEKSNNSAIPYFPNYRLGADTGSPCYTPTKENKKMGIAIQVYPTIFESKLRIERIEGHDGQPIFFELFDVMGRLRKQQEMTSYQAILDLDVSNLSSETYFYRIFNAEKGVLKTGKLIKK